MNSVSVTRARRCRVENFAVKKLRRYATLDLKSGLRVRKSSFSSRKSSGASSFSITIVRPACIRTWEKIRLNGWQPPKRVPMRWKNEYGRSMGMISSDRPGEGIAYRFTGRPPLGRTKHNPAATDKTKLTHHKIGLPRFLLKLVQFAEIIRHIVVAERNHFFDRLLARTGRHFNEQLLSPLFKGHGDFAHRSISLNRFYVYRNGEAVQHGLYYALRPPGKQA